MKTLQSNSINKKQNGREQSKSEKSSTLPRVALVNVTTVSTS